MISPLLLPVIAAQGLWVRTTVRAAAGPTDEPSGTVTGSDLSRLRLAVVGESTAAGCGVDRHTDGFAAALAGEMAARTGQAVDWLSAGRYGATARRIRTDLLPVVGSGFNLVVVLAGVNDVLTHRRPPQWHDDLSGLLDDLRGRTTTIAVTGIPPFTLFPSLPAALARYLAGRAAALDRMSEKACSRRAVFVPADFDTVPPDFFSADRFHPSAAGYRHWAVSVAERLEGASL